MARLSGAVSRPSFSERLAASLDELEQRYADILDRSAIRNVDPNRLYPNSGAFIGFPSWGWEPDETLVPDRTHLLAAVNDRYALFRLLHRSALPETEKRINDAMELIRGWLAREGGDYSIPSTIDRAREKVTDTFAELRALVVLGTHGPAGVIAVPDTNVLISDPDVATYATALGTDDYVVVLLTTVMRELDDLKDRGRTPDVRDKAAAAVRRVKGLRDRGDLRTGVKVAGKVTLRAEHREVDVRGVLDWLDPDVPDDRILGSALDLQARQPSATVVLVTGDINLQNKAAAVGMPFADP